MQILVYDDAGRLSVSSAVAQKYQEIQEQLDTYTSQQQELRSQILDAMIENKVTTSKSLGYTFSLVQPRDKEIFDSDSFIEHEEVAIISLFTNVDETEDVDLEMLKNEFPEAYNKCKKITRTYEVDVKKLQKSLPEVYNKYVTIVPATGNTTIKVTKGK